MRTRSRRFRRHALSLGFLAALVPLILLLWLQYHWLMELEETSGMAHQATLENYLGTVTEVLELEVRKSGEKTLNFYAWLFVEDQVEKAAKRFAQEPTPMARRRFVVDFDKVDGQYKLQLGVFDPHTKRLTKPDWDRDAEELLAVYGAVSPWSMLAREGGTLGRAQLVVDERDPEHRIMLQPVTDDDARIVGVAGMILDQEYIGNEWLPEATEKFVHKLFPESRWEDLVVTVEDGLGETVFTTAPEGWEAPAEALSRERRFTFAFTDWTVRLTSLQPTAGQWAWANFQMNFGLSLLLALVLLGGLTLALRSASREMKLSEMKSDFVSNVSHELRTPLSSIRVFGELLRLGKVEGPAKVREYGEYIETESRRLTRLINNILDFSRIESGAKSYQLERADLTELVAETLEVFEVSLRQKGFRIVFERPEEPLPVKVDSGALAQSVSNLVDNAVKYSDGNREIAVRIRREDDEAVVSVQDWGVGIPRSEQEKIFDRFHRVGTGLVHDVKGSGLGLAIVRHIVQAHGGRVTVNSRTGHGSTFSIHLPLDAEARAESSGELPGLAGEATP